MDGNCEAVDHSLRFYMYLRYHHRVEFMAFLHPLAIHFLSRKGRRSNLLITINVVDQRGQDHGSTLFPNAVIEQCLGRYQDWSAVDLTTPVSERSSTSLT